MSLPGEYLYVLSGHKRSKTTLTAYEKNAIYDSAELSRITRVGHLKSFYDDITRTQVELFRVLCMLNSFC